MSDRPPREPESDGPLRILVVDDEPLGRRAVLRQVERCLPGAETREARDGFEALELVRAFAPALVFLDVEMPELSGLDVVRQLAPPRPKVVFVTAFAAFAVHAFEENACDYLVKPFTPERFALAATRALRELAGEERLRALEHSLRADGSYLARLGLKLGTRLDVVALADVSALVSRGHYTYVYALGREYLTELTLVHLEERLDPRLFARAHRSALVNLEKVRRIADGPPGAVELTDGTSVPLSRRNRAALLERLGVR